MSKQQISPATVAHAIGEWGTFDGPLYRRLGEVMQSAIARGDLPVGVCLPAERRLAAALSVSRGTVVAAYELLRDARLVDRRHGSGTWITSSGLDADIVYTATAVSAGRLTGRLVSTATDVIDLGVSILPDAAALPTEALRVDRADLERLADRHGYQPAGLPSLRQRLAALHTASGLATSPGQIVVTTGAQQAIVLAAQVLVRAGDTVVIERPTYPGAIEAFARAGAQLVGIDVDGAGARVEDLATAAKKYQAQVAYVVATCQNPTGAVMPEGRRIALAALAQRGLTVIDDASVAHLTFDGDPPPLIATFAGPEAPVLTIGSLSKLLWGGLRVGWIRAPRTLAARLARAKASTDIGSSALTQTVALQALEDHDDIVETLRTQQAARSLRLQDLLTELLPEWRFTQPAGGLSLWVELPFGTADAFAPVAARHGVVLLPGSAMSIEDAHPRHLRLSFALDPELLAEGVRRLAAAWAAHTDDQAPRSSVAAG